MQNYLVIAFLLGFSPFCFFNTAKGMEDNSTEGLTLHSTPQPLYVVSLKKYYQPLSNSELRKKHPITNITYGNLDEKLYRTEITSNKLEYNPSFEEVKGVLEKLKLTAHNPYSTPKKEEIDSVNHLFLATTSLLEGTNGMPQDRHYGISLMQWYIRELYSQGVSHFRDILVKYYSCSEQNFRASDFLEELRAKDSLFEQQFYKNIFSLAITPYFDSFEQSMESSQLLASKRKFPNIVKTEHETSNKKASGPSPKRRKTQKESDQDL